MDESSYRAELEALPTKEVYLRARRRAARRLDVRFFWTLLRNTPNDVTLTPAEVERARADEDFFLAVVAGLEEGAGELRVRFIFDPLSRLPLRLRGDLTLGGVRDAEELEYVFPLSVDSRL